MSVLLLQACLRERLLQLEHGSQLTIPLITIALQGVKMKYEEFVTPAAIAHRKECETKKAQEDARREKLERAAREKEQAIVKRLAPAVERSKLL